MKNKGFTLVELLSVIILLGIIITLAVPSALKLSNDVKEKAYNTKIDLIESSAANYALDIKNEIKNGGECNVDGVTYNPCKKVTVKELAKKNIINYDEKDVCSKINCKSKIKEEKEPKTIETAILMYDNQVVNPIDNTIINDCEVILYIKNNRTYAKFDKTNCIGYE